MNWKRISLIVAVVVSSMLTWEITRVWLNNPERFSSIVVMLWPALACIVSGAITAVAFMLMEHAWDRVAATVASWATFIFFWAPDIWYVSILPVFFLFWWVAGRNIRHDLTDRHVIRPTIILGQGMKFFLLGTFLMVSLGFYLLPSNRPTLTSVSKSVQKSVTNNPIVEQQLKQLPTSARAEFQRQVGQQVDTLVRTWLGPIKNLIPPILAFGLFLVLWSVNFFIREPAIWVGSLLFKLLRRFKFIAVGKKGVEAEVISL